MVQPVTSKDFLLFLTLPYHIKLIKNRASSLAGTLKNQHPLLKMDLDFGVVLEEKISVLLQNFTRLIW